MLLLLWLTILVPNLDGISWLPLEPFTTVLGACIVIILLPVVWQGPWTDRFLALLLMVFPVLTLAAIWLILPNISIRI